MKKLVLIATLAAAISAPAMAESRSGAYVQGDLAGYAHLNGKQGTLKANEDVYAPRISVGYDTGSNFRTALDYTHYNDIDNKTTEGANNLNISMSETKVRSAGVSAIYDIETGTAIKPYVGGRVGVNKINSRTETGADESGNYKFWKNKKTKVGVGAMVGASYQITDNVDVEAGYRYNYLGKFQDLKLQSHEASAGVRYRF